MINKQTKTKIFKITNIIAVLENHYRPQEKLKMNIQLKNNLKIVVILIMIIVQSCLIQDQLN